MACTCDYDPPSLYQRYLRKARKQHICDECGSKILPGQQYEHVFGVWNGDPGSCDTCAACLELREYVEAHVPCFCWAHHNVHEDAIETASHWNREAPGLLFGAYRKLIAIRRNRSVQRQLA